jgi:2-polyprenyl-6-methoxyphenol hydroxylase-like FAD-dependent oxidoreductase
VGAGPCGLLLAVLLSKQGIEVHVLEAAEKLDDQPRACHYSAPSKYELARAGVLEQIAAEGFHPGSVCWRTIDGTRIVGLSNEEEPEESVLRMVCLELGRVIQILHDTAVQQSNCQIHMNHRVVSLGQSGEVAWVDVMQPSGETKKLEADYIVGCDGANSQVRRSLFGDGDFPGSTWDQQIIASNV